MEHQKGSIAQFIKFAITGGVNTAVDAAVFALCIHLGLGIYSSQTLGYGAGMLNSYLVNRRWTFDSRDKLFGPTALRFFGANLCLLLLSLGVVHVLGTILGLHIVVVKGAAMCVTVGLGFMVNRLWVFKKV